MNKLLSAPLMSGFSLILFFSMQLNAQKKIELEYNLKQGQLYDYQIEVDQDISFKANEQTMTLDQLMKFGTTAEVVHTSNDSISIQTTIEHIESRQGIFGMELIYISDDTTTHTGMAAQMAMAMNQLIKASYTTSIDNKGNVIHMDFSQLVANNDVAGNLNTGNNFGLYPKRKVAVGDSWEQDLVPLEGSDMKTHATYTLKSFTGKKAVLGFEGVLRANDINGEDMKLEGTQSGELIVDRKTGWLISSIIEQEVEMEMEKDGMKFPATISGTVSITSSEK